MKSFHMFALALAVFKIIQFKMIDLKSRSRSLGVNLAVVSFVGKISKSINRSVLFFALAFTVSEI